MNAWSPLWNTIVTSTLWSESKEVRILFVTMLALKDGDGVVISSLVGLSRLANLSKEECAAAVSVLESPDTKSETIQEFDGRRIEKIEGGWRILNHVKYLDLMDDLKRKIKQRTWQKAYRDRQRSEKSGGNGAIHNPPPNSQLADDAVTQTGMGEPEKPSAPGSVAAWSADVNPA